MNGSKLVIGMLLGASLSLSLSLGLSACTAQTKRPENGSKNGPDNEIEHSGELKTKPKMKNMPKNKNMQRVDKRTPELKKLATTALNGHYGYDITRELTTKLGPRQAGSKAEADARNWAVAKMLDMGFENVRVEPFKINGWARGAAEAAIVSPFPQPLVITALGGSVATPEQGLTAAVVYFKDYEALLAAPAGSLNGKIAFISGKMQKDIDGKGYSPANMKRRNGASEAAKRGAIAVLIRSVGTDSHRLPHTGQMRYEKGVGRIPIAALSNPDADQLERVFGDAPNQVVLHLKLTPRDLGEQISGNVIGEIKGQEKPDEIILISGHLDSWDQGTGAIDDGAGVGIALGAAKALMDSGLKPKRTIRVVLFGSEEIGLKGGFAYAEAHKDELAKHVLASESDFGAGPVYGLQAGKYGAVKEFVKQIAPSMAPLGIQLKAGVTHGGPDIIPLNDLDVPTIRLNQNGTDYFDLHHTPDDTFDKINPKDMAQNVAAWAQLVWLASQADIDFRGGGEGE